MPVKQLTNSGETLPEKSRWQARFIAPKWLARSSTQGGLSVDGDARVLAEDGLPLPNLFAAGGAARGISGDGADGYLAGNGLLTATSFGKLAGRAAAKQVLGEN